MLAFECVPPQPIATTFASAGSLGPPAHLGVDLGAAALGDLIFFQDDNTGTLTHYKSATLGIEGSGSLQRRVIEVCSEGLGAGEACQCQWLHAGLGAASERHICVAQSDKLGRVDDVVRARRAGCHERVVGPADAVSDGDLRSGHVQQNLRHEKGRDLAMLALVDSCASRHDLGECADPAAHTHSAASFRPIPPHTVDGAVLRRGASIGICESLVCRDKRHLDKGRVS